MGRWMDVCMAGSEVHLPLWILITNMYAKKVELHL